MVILKQKEFAARGFKELRIPNLEHIHKSLLMSVTQYYVEEKEEVSNVVKTIYDKDNDIIKIEAGLCIMDLQQWKELQSFITEIIADYVPYNSETRIRIDTKFHNIYTEIVNK